MTLLLKQIFAFFKLLNSDTGTYSLAWGLSLGVVLGFAPFFSLQTFLILLIAILFRVQLGAAFISAFFFKFVAYLADGWADSLGRWALELEALRPLYVQLYNMPIVPFTRFNNSIVMGSLLVSFLLTPILFFVFKALIIKYRQTVVVRFKNSAFWKAFTATRFYSWYVKYDQLYG